MHCLALSTSPRGVHLMETRVGAQGWTQVKSGPDEVRHQVFTSQSTQANWIMPLSFRERPESNHLSKQNNAVMLCCHEIAGGTSKGVTAQWQSLISVLHLSISTHRVMSSKGTSITVTPSNRVHFNVLKGDLNNCYTAKQYAGYATAVLSITRQPGDVTWSQVKLAISSGSGSAVSSVFVKGSPRRSQQRCSRPSRRPAMNLLPLHWHSLASSQSKMFHWDSEWLGISVSFGWPCWDVSLR